jgi:hypothetical protein
MGISHVVHRAQDRLPVTIMRILEEIEKQAGMACTILLGGPEPKRGGKLTLMKFHSGQTRMGNDFEAAYEEWHDNVEAPFARHLRKVFCEIFILHSVPALTNTIFQRRTNAMLVLFRSIHHPTRHPPQARLPIVGLPA